ncbi:DUF4349 domain-containing protein [uncultured Acetobacteroides sp.]|uniref:DUF4349 domain-containing protein n=1 Tax=uncultured Acetobacteroides sp. TaxID=1760811 RepID=UPI0029F4CBFA|nr:DUF4349 domain-containing protein [uncultured Acetobacteroides sp.]
MKLKILVLFLFAISLASCGAPREQNVEVTNLCKINVDPSMNKVQTKKLDKRKLIKNGELSLNVVNVTEAQQKIENAIKSMGGYCDKEEFLQSDNSEYGDVNKYVYYIRVPADRFEHLVATMESGSNNVLDKTITTEDVTDRYHDNEMHLNIQRAYLKRYSELLKKAKNVKDIIEVQTKIDEIEDEINTLLGSLNSLDDQIAYSTLKVSLVYKRDVSSKTICKGSYPSRIGSALKSGALGFVDFTVFLVNIWPFWIVLAITVYVWRKIRAKKRLKKNKE